MSSVKPRHLLRIEYEAAAEAYLRSLPPEHFMEATAQATQREITVESLALLHAARPEIQYFNELLVQYPFKGRRGIKQVVPDNMVVLHPEPIKAGGSFDLPLQPVGPFWVMEYVSKHNHRKDYERSFTKYERDLKVPYYLLFYPDEQELTLYRHTRTKYVSVKPNENGRYALAQLDLEVALLDGWVRFWYKGELLPLPADLQRSLIEAQQRAEAEKRRADAEAQRADTEARRADAEALRAEDLQRQLAAALRQLEEAQTDRPAAKPRPTNPDAPRRTSRRG
jgi:Uma2 family endonuclease